MKTIQILGTGCPKCRKLEEISRQAADALGLDYRVEKITDVVRFAEFGVMMTPAMALDGELKVSGRIPSVEELKQLLQ